jgi:hypothetical protein
LCGLSDKEPVEHFEIQEFTRNAHSVRQPVPGHQTALGIRGAELT